MSKTVDRRPSSLASLEPEEKLRLLRILLFVALGIRLIYAAAMELVPDESYYWLWTRHLALGYFDHPPMIAYVIWLGTWLFGDKELGVRVVIALMSVGTIAIIIAMGKRVLRDDRAMVWVALIWLTSPLMMGLGILATPDTPVVFFSTCALTFVALIVDRDDQLGAGDRVVGGRGSRRAEAGSKDAARREPRPPVAAERRVGGSPVLWALFGIFSGLAMVSKYTGVLLPFAVAMMMLTTAKGRAHYRRPWVYLSGVLALAVFSPVVWWNKQHAWVSFLFQLRHGTMDGHPSASAPVAAAIVRFFADIGTYLGGQLVIWTPLLFVVTIVVLVYYWRRYRTITQLDRLLLWTGTVPLVFFGLAVLASHHTEPNWPAFAYVPSSLLIGRWLAENWSNRRIGLVRGGVQVATAFLIGMLVLAAPPVTRWVVRRPFHVPHAICDLVGWRQFGQWLGNQTTQYGNVPVVANMHQNAGQAAFYMPGQPQVWSESIGSRPDAFDYFDERPDFARIPAVFWLGGHHDLFAKKYGLETAVQTTYYGGRPPNGRVEEGYLLVRPGNVKR
ncbi:MAG TPA: glycosyltransferase family 39 protein [Tepidisphaeraceae bacterium]|jgi:4-amino-4-deoxy-L-arabinose transferase-like glycosyltransferase